MKRKKLLSTAVAGMLVAAQMVMPVMAAPDGGEVDVDVTTKRVVIRVEVPTSLAVAVNQFEKGDAGSQIYSETFDITNKSEIPVKVKVSSEATVANTVTLVGKKAAAEESEDAEAWLAIAALVDAGKFIDDSTDNTLGIKDLNEDSENVATFVQDEATTTKATAEQVFYLGTATNPTATYKLAKGTTTTANTPVISIADAKKISYAQFYEVEAKTLTGVDDAAKQKEVDDLLAAGDVYVETSTALTLVERGDSHNYASGDTYYTLIIASGAKEPARVEAEDLANDKVYVYGEAGDGDEAGFRYIGKLSEGQDTWAAADISHVKISYEITGVTTTKFDEISDPSANLLKYGLYIGSGSGSSTTTEVNGVRVTNGSGSTTYSTGADVANRLKSGAVQFVLDSSTATTVKTGSIAVTKIEIDGTEYTPTTATNANAHTDADGKTYSIAGFTANSVSTIKVYYGTDLIVKYTF